MAQEDYVHTPTSWWFSDPFISSELRSLNAVWYQDLRDGSEVYAGYGKDSFGEPVELIPSPVGGIPPWPPSRPMPPYYHPVPPPLDLPPVLPGNIVELITCRIKAASAVIVVFPPIDLEPPNNPALPSMPASPPPDICNDMAEKKSGRGVLCFALTTVSWR